MSMVKCPDCMKEYREHQKRWKCGRFDVEAYTCSCSTDFRESRKQGKHLFAF